MSIPYHLLNEIFNSSSVAEQSTPGGKKTRKRTPKPKKFSHQLRQGNWIPCDAGWFNIGLAKGIVDRAKVSEREWYRLRTALNNMEGVTDISPRQWTKLILMFSKTRIMIL